MWLLLQGKSCFHCKTHLYTALQAVEREGQSLPGPLILYNGTNLDDRKVRLSIIRWASN